MLQFNTIYLGDGDDEYDNFYGDITQHMPLQGRLYKQKPRHMPEICSLETVCIESELERV